MKQAIQYQLTRLGVAGHVVERDNGIMELAASGVYARGPGRRILMALAGLEAPADARDIIGVLRAVGVRIIPPPGLRKSVRQSQRRWERHKAGY